MRTEEVFAEVELKSRARSVSVLALVDTGALRSVISKGVAEALGFTFYEEPHWLGTAEEGGRLKLIGFIAVSE